MKKTYALTLVAALTALTMFATMGTAGATGVGINAVGGCTTILPLFPTPAGAAPLCTTPTGGTTVPLPTDGNTQYVGAGVDDSNSPYVFAALGVPGGTSPAGVTATVPSYSEPCVAGEPSAIGLANGVLSVSIPAAATTRVGQPASGATLSTDYAWVRVGLTAVVRTGVLAGGTGVVDFTVGADDTGIAAAGAIVAQLLPIPPLGTCAAPLPLEVHVLAFAGLNALIG